MKITSAFHNRAPFLGIDGMQNSFNYKRPAYLNLFQQLYFLIEGFHLRGEEARKFIGRK